MIWVLFGLFAIAVGLASLLRDARAAARQAEEDAQRLAVRCSELREELAETEPRIAPGRADIKRNGRDRPYRHPDYRSPAQQVLDQRIALARLHMDCATFHSPDCDCVRTYGLFARAARLKEI